jgi:hypothetical protein
MYSILAFLTTPMIIKPIIENNTLIKQPICDSLFQTFSQDENQKGKHNRWANK